MHAGGWAQDVIQISYWNGTGAYPTVGPPPPPPPPPLSPYLSPSFYFLPCQEIKDCLVPLLFRSSSLFLLFCSRSLARSLALPHSSRFWLARSLARSFHPTFLPRPSPITRSHTHTPPHRLSIFHHIYVACAPVCMYVCSSLLPIDFSKAPLLFLFYPFPASSDPPPLGNDARRSRSRERFTSARSVREILCQAFAPCLVHRTGR